MKTQTHFFTFGLLSIISGCAHLKSEAPADEFRDHPEQIQSEDVSIEITTDENLPETQAVPPVEQEVEMAKAKSEEGQIPDQLMDAGEGMRSPAPSAESEPADIGGLMGRADIASALGSKGSGIGGGGLASPKRKSASAVGYGKVSRSYGAAASVDLGQSGGSMAGFIEEDPHVQNAQSTEQYTDYGVNPFTKTEDDALSTFSIDVDTASYTIARRKIESGALPPMASVRAEEFINYFDYNYDSTDAQPFDVHVDGMVDPFRSDHHIVRVGVQGKELTAATRPPLHLTFLVDVSGSMTGPDKLGLAQKAMRLLTETLQEGDTVALATYAGRVARVLEPTSGSNTRVIISAIDSLRSGGSTAMSSGIDIAYDMAWEAFEPGAENRVVVLSDGDANVGNTGWETMLSQIKGYADRGVTLSTIGLGMGNYKDTTMEQLANKGDGNNFYIDSFKEAHKVFVEGFNGTMISIARDVKIQVELNPDRVQSYRLIGYENRDIADKDFRNDRVDAGEVGAGHSVTALYELKLTDDAFAHFGPSDLMTVRLRYEAPGADKSASERAWTYKHHSLEGAESNPSLRLAYTAGTFAEILRRSPYTNGISLQALADYAETSVRSGHQEDAELLSLIEKAVRLNETETVVLR